MFTICMPYVMCGRDFFRDRDETFSFRNYEPRPEKSRDRGISVSSPSRDFQLKWIKQRAFLQRIAWMKESAISVDFVLFI
jgi:hypothetical protein